jgi:hypothetical protein
MRCSIIVASRRHPANQRQYALSHGRPAHCRAFHHHHHLRSSKSLSSSQILLVSFPPRTTECKPPLLAYRAMVSTLSPSERSYILTGLSHPTSPTRLDGRSLLASRPISVSYGDAPQASGSARVVLGGTEVLAGVRLEVADVDPSDPSDPSAWRTRVEVDV